MTSRHTPCKRRPVAAPRIQPPDDRHAVLLRLPSDLHAQVKARAAEHRRSFTKEVEVILLAVLARHPKDLEVSI